MLAPALSTIETSQSAEDPLAPHFMPHPPMKATSRLVQDQVTHVMASQSMIVTSQLVQDQVTLVKESPSMIVTSQLAEDLAHLLLKQLMETLCLGV